MKRISIALLALSIVGCSTAVETNTETIPPIVIEPVVSTVVVTEPPTTTETPTTTTLPIDWAGVAASIELGISEARALYGRCGEWYELAMSVGWKPEEWSTLSTVLWTESRCTIDAWNGHDAGLTQINQIHTAWANEMGFDFPTDLFDPTNNLYFAYRLYSAREEKGLCGWKPWSEPCKN